jgi:sulfite exporter TauE/SafE
MSGLWSDILAACTAMLQEGSLSPALAVGRPAGMLLLGLTGGAVHCAGMCGPFVLSQVGSRLAQMPVEASAGLVRLQGMALLPYHAGRASTYTLLGAAAAGLTGGVAPVLLQGYAPALLLAMAGLLFLSFAMIQLAPRLQLALPGQWMQRWLQPLFRQPGGSNGYLLGLGLGFLPCGLVYSALLLAGASGNWRDGALAMAAFAAGTMPALLVVGWLGAAAGQRWRGWMRRLLVPVLVFNALLLFAMAARWLAGGV